MNTPFEPGIRRRLTGLTGLALAGSLVLSGGALAQPAEQAGERTQERAHTRPGRRQRAGQRQG